VRVVWYWTYSADPFFGYNAFLDSSDSDNRHIPREECTAVRRTFILPFLALCVLWHGMPPLQASLWIYVLLFGLGQTLGTLSLSEALKLAEIPLVTPYWRLTLDALLSSFCLHLPI
jgi:uncharacterized membrane protein